MKDNELIISSELHIQFDTVAVIYRFLESRKRILRDVLIIEETAVGDKNLFVGRHTAFTAGVWIDSSEIDNDENNDQLHKLIIA